MKEKIYFFKVYNKKGIHIDNGLDDCKQGSNLQKYFKRKKLVCCGYSILENEENETLSGLNKINNSWDI